MLTGSDFERVERKVRKSSGNGSAPPVARLPGAGTIDRSAWDEGDVEVLSEGDGEEEPKPTRKAATPSYDDETEITEKNRSLRARITSASLV